MYLWAEAARTTMYVHKRTPHWVLDNKTLEEAFSWEKPEVSRLRIFGCLVYIHIPNEKKTKLDPFGRKGIFIGYSDTLNAYLIYFPWFNNIDISRDVTFDEYSAYFRSRTPNQEFKEPEDTRALDMEIGEAIQEDHGDQDMAEPKESVEIIIEKDSHKRNPTWARDLIWEATRYSTPEGILREGKRENPCNSYVATIWLI